MSRVPALKLQNPNITFTMCRVFPMTSEKKIIFVVLAALLVPVLLGTTPMNLVQRLSSPLPQSLDKQIERSSSCLFNSIAVQHDLGDAGLNSDLFEWDSADPIQISLDDVVGFHSSPSAVILRC